MLASEGGECGSCGASNASQLLDLEIVVQMETLLILFCPIFRFIHEIKGQLLKQILLHLVNYMSLNYSIAA